GEHLRADPETGEERLQYLAFMPPGERFGGDLKNAMRWKLTCGLGLIMAPRIIAQVGLLDASWTAPDTEYILRILAHKLDYRFVALRLYRHVTFPHSVGKSQDKMRRDRIRLMLRSLMWDPAAPGPYPLKHLADEVGLSDAEIERVLWFLWRASR